MAISTAELDEMLGKWVAVHGTEGRIVAWHFIQPLESHAQMKYSVEYRSGAIEIVPASACFRLHPRES